MATMTTVEIWVVVDYEGDAAVGLTERDAVEAFEDACCPLGETGPSRRVKILLQVPLPEEARLTGTVPPEGDATLTVAS